MRVMISIILMVIAALVGFFFGAGMKMKKVCSGRKENKLYL